jgi:hypothetical protein
VRDELAAGRGADGEQAEVEVAGGERLGGRLLDPHPRQLPAGGARRGEQAHVAVASLAQKLERDRADGTRCADDPDARVAQARHGA